MEPFWIACFFANDGSNANDETAFLVAVNVNEFRTGKDPNDCIYDDPRGWPHWPWAS